MRILLFLLAFGLFAVDRGGAQTETPQSGKTAPAELPPFAGWVNAGACVSIQGFTSYCYGFGLEGNLAYRHLLLTLRGNHYTGFSNWEYDEFTVFSSTPLEFTDLALTAGWLLRDNTGKMMFTTGGGLSFLINERYLENTGETIRKKTTGLALGMQANFFLNSIVGVGSSMFGSINGELSYYGVLLHLNVGFVPVKRRS